MYGTDKSEEDKEEVEGTVLGGGGEEFSVMPVVYPRGTVRVLSLSSFLYVVSSSNTSHPPLTLSHVLNHIQEYFKKNRGRRKKYIKPQEEKARRKNHMKQMRVTFRAKLVLGYWELVSMEPGADNSSEQVTAIVTKELEEPATK